MNEIHPSAVIDPTAQLGERVTIGPYCVIGPGVVIGDDCVLKQHVVVERGVKMGRDNHVFANVVLGEEPQILGLRDPDTQLLIGDGNIFRESVNISRGSPRGEGKTVVGHHNYFMVGVHLGHDVTVEDHVLLGNYVQIAGHVWIEPYAVLSANCSIHQFATVGRYCFTGGFTAAQHDVPPYMRVTGIYRLEIHGPNVLGLGRNGFSRENISALNEAHRRLYRQREGVPFARILQTLLDEDLDSHVRYLAEFLQRSSEHRFGRYRETLRHK